MSRPVRAIGGIGPGAGRGVRAEVEARALRKMREAAVDYEADGIYVAEVQRPDGSRLRWYFENSPANVRRVRGSVAWSSSRLVGESWQSNPPVGDYLTDAEELERWLGGEGTTCATGSCTPDAADIGRLRTALDHLPKQ